MLLCKDVHEENPPKDVMEMRIILRMLSKITKSVFTHLKFNLSSSQFSYSGTAITRENESNYCLHAATSTFRSHNSNASPVFKGPSSPSPGNLQTVIPTPLIFRLVTSGPSKTRSTTQCFFASSSLANSAKAASTASLVLPRLFNTNTTWCGLSAVAFAGKGTKARSSSEVLVIRSIICATSLAGAGGGVSCCRPGSPWAPMPSSMVSGGRRGTGATVPVGSETLGDR